MVESPSADDLLDDRAWMRKYTLKLILRLAVVGALLLGFGTLIIMFFYLRRSESAASHEILLAAFSGAFFSFLFIRLGEFLTKLYRRKEKGLSALVILQHRLNYLLVQVDDNIWLAGHFLNVVSYSVRSGEAIRASRDRLSTFRVEEDLLVDLTNLDLINELFALNVSLLKANDSIDTIRRLYDSTLEPLKEGKLDEEMAAIYNSNIMRVLEGMTDINDYMSGLLEDAKGLLAKVRVLSRQQTVFGWVLRKITPTSYPPGFEAQVRDELARLEEEMEASRLASQERIDFVKRRETRT